MRGLISHFSPKLPNFWRKLNFANYLLELSNYQFSLSDEPQSNNGTILRGTSGLSAGGAFAGLRPPHPPLNLQEPLTPIFYLANH